VISRLSESMVNSIYWQSHRSSRKGPVLCQETTKLKPTVRYNEDLDTESIKPGCWLCRCISCKHVAHTSWGDLVGTGSGITVVVPMAVEVTVVVIAEVIVEVIEDVIVEVRAEVTVEVVVAEMTVVRALPSCSRFNLC
jgi:hypothetical protein